MRRKLISRGWAQTVMMIVSAAVLLTALLITVQLAFEVVISLACAFGGWG